MFYADCISIATHQVSDWDLPEGLLPLTLANEAAALAGLDSDHLGCPPRE